MELLTAALATEGLWLLGLGAVLAGVVRGFTGFGNAMVYLPFAGQVLEPVWVLVTMVIIDMIGPLPEVPRAIREGHPRDVLRLGAGALIGVPIGVSVLVALQPELFRTAVSVLSLGLLVALVAGLRYRGPVGKPMIFGIGAGAGFLGGAVGLPGPLVILLYMARPLPAQVIRASTLLYLILADILMFGTFARRGLLAPEPILLGLVLVLPYLLAIRAGSAIFDPRHATLYRWVAYAIIAGSALSGLPVWD